MPEVWSSHRDFSIPGDAAAKVRAWPMLKNAKQEKIVETFVVLRRGAWKSEEDLEDSAAVSTRIADEEMDGEVRWIRSYVLSEEDGTLGTVCIYQAVDEDAIMEHAERAEIPADEVIPVLDTVIVRDDP
jgi:hypothetical protein